MFMHRTVRSRFRRNDFKIWSLRFGVGGYIMTAVYQVLLCAVHLIFVTYINKPGLVSPISACNVRKRFHSDAGCSLPFTSVVRGRGSRVRFQHSACSRVWKPSSRTYLPIYFCFLSQNSALETLYRSWCLNLSVHWHPLVRSKLYEPAEGWCLIELRTGCWKMRLQVLPFFFTDMILPLVFWRFRIYVVF